MVANVIFFGVVLNEVFTLITLLFEDCSKDAIHAIDMH